MNIQIPNEINDITLGEYQMFDKANVEGADPDFLLHKTIEVFCNVDIKDVAKFPVEEAEDINNLINEVLQQKADLKMRFEMDGVEYGLIPDMSQMSLGEYIDLEESLKDTQSFHKAAAVIYRPVKTKFRDLYTIEPYEASVERGEYMKKIPLGIISASIVFFYNIARELLQASPEYSKNLEETSKITLEEVNSLQNMDGSTAYTHFLGVIQQNLEV